MKSQKYHFKEGDRVIALRNGWADLKAGDTGTILHIIDTLAVRWDRNIGGHDCGMQSECTYGYGAFIDQKDVAPLEDDTIIPSTLEAVL